jgi:hypothetical protein
MASHYVTTRGLSHRSLSAVLVLWLCGAGCALGCLNMTDAAAAEIDATIVADQTEVTAMDAGHECCRARSPVRRAAHADRDQVQKRLLSVTSSSDGVRCCLLTSTAVLAVPEKRTVTQQVGAVAQIFNPPSVERAIPCFTKASAEAPRSRGHTYLECCVFLI